MLSFLALLMGRPNSRGDRMQKWEYCELGRGYLVRYTTRGYESLVSQEKDPKRITDAFARQFAILGDEGWELVGFTTDSLGHNTYVFKRPKP
jgi:hypothetical protein